MGLGLREKEEGSPPCWRRVMLWGTGMVSGKLRAFTVVQNGDVVLGEQCWSVEG